MAASAANALSIQTAAHAHAPGGKLHHAKASSDTALAFADLLADTDAQSDAQPPQTEKSQSKTADAAPIIKSQAADAQTAATAAGNGPRASDMMVADPAIAPIKDSAQSGDKADDKRGGKDEAVANDNVLPAPASQPLPQPDPLSPAQPLPLAASQITPAVAANAPPDRAALQDVSAATSPNTASGVSTALPPPASRGAAAVNADKTDAAAPAPANSAAPTRQAATVQADASPVDDKDTGDAVSAASLAATSLTMAAAKAPADDDKTSPAVKSASGKPVRIAKGATADGVQTQSDAKADAVKAGDAKSSDAQTTDATASTKTPAAAPAGTNTGVIGHAVGAPATNAVADKNLVTAQANMPAAPAHQPPNVHALAVEISAKSQSGARQFDIRLDPPELGRVEVRLSIDAAGKAQAHLSAEQPQTLDLLQKDAPALTRALREAGLDVSQGALNFSLRSQQQQTGGDQGGQQNRGGGSFAMTGKSIETSISPGSAYVNGAGLLDIKV